MDFKKYFIFSLMCFFAISCGTVSQPQKSSPQYKLKKPVFYTKDGSEFLVLTGPGPDGEKAKIIIPNGQGFASAKLKKFDSDEELKVSVNNWLNKLCTTNSVEFLKPDIQIAPIMRDEGQYDISESDLVFVKDQLKNRGISYNITSSEEGLTCIK